MSCKRICCLGSSISVSKEEKGSTSWWPEICSSNQYWYSKCTGPIYRLVFQPSQLGNPARFCLHPALRQLHTHTQTVFETSKHFWQIFGILIENSHVKSAWDETDRSLKMDRSLHGFWSIPVCCSNRECGSIKNLANLKFDFFEGRKNSSPKIKEREKNFSAPLRRWFRWSYLPIGQYVGPTQPQMLVQETAAWSHSCGRYLWGHTRHPDKTRVEFVGISHTTIHHPFQLHISSSKSSSFWWVLQDQEVVLLEEGHIHSAGTT